MIKDKKLYLQDAYLLMSRLKRQVEFLKDGLLVEYTPKLNAVAENQRYKRVLQSCESAAHALDALCDALDFLKAV